jgi:enolase
MTRPTRIAAVRGRRVFDSRGRPTVEADVVLEGGALGRAIAPAGASRGSAEAVDLRDGGSAYGGLDVQRALQAIAGPIAAALRGLDAADQSAIDACLIATDATPDKSRLGGNALTAVSIATAQAAAAAKGLPLWRHLAGDGAVSLPLPQVQIFGGGAHAARRLDIQDLMVVPLRAASFADALAAVAAIYRAAGALMTEQGKLAGVADEGGYWPRFASNEEALATLVRAIERAGLRPGTDAGIALDLAASEFGRAGRYRLALDGLDLDRDGLAALWLDWLDRYPIVSIEDPFAEDDRPAWMRFCAVAGARVQIVGDDYLVTQAARVRAAAADAACNAALIKPNQAGTLTEAHAALDAARDAGMATIVSARSGESEDHAIAHLAVGWNAGQLKVGSFARSERMAKWNEVLRIEETLGSQAHYAGAAALAVDGARGSTR